MPTAPSTDPLSRALSGVIPPIALLAVLVVGLYPFRDDLGSGTIALILLLPPLAATVGGLWVALALAVVCALTWGTGVTSYPCFSAARRDTVRSAVRTRLEKAATIAATSRQMKNAATLSPDSIRNEQQGSEFLHTATIDLMTAVGLGAVRLHVAAPATGPIDVRAGPEVEEDRLLSFSVSSGARALGVLEVAPGRRELTDDERLLLEQFAEVVAIALSHRPHDDDKPRPLQPTVPRTLGPVTPPARCARGGRSA